jgi:hypothetical protein
MSVIPGSAGLRIILSSLGSSSVVRSTYVAARVARSADVSNGGVLSLGVAHT